MKITRLAILASLITSFMACHVTAQVVTGGEYTTVSYASNGSTFPTPNLRVNFDAANIVAWRSFQAGSLPTNSGGTVKQGAANVIGDAYWWANNAQTGSGSIVFDWTGGAAGVATYLPTAVGNSAIGNGYNGVAGRALEFLVTPGSTGSYEFTLYGSFAQSGGFTLPTEPGYTKLELFNSSNVLLSSYTLDHPDMTQLNWTNNGYSQFQFTITDPTQYLRVTYETANSANAFKGLYGASLATVPEPGTYALLAVSFALMIVVRKRKQKLA